MSFGGIDPGGSEEHHRAAHQAIASELGAALWAKRTELGLSQREVAHRAGIGVQTYRRLERGEASASGKSNPTLDTILRVLHALVLHPSDLVTRFSDPEVSTHLTPHAEGTGSPLKPHA